MGDKEQWVKFIETWKSFEPPIVPSKKEIDIYENFIKNVKGKKAFIFGATPQLRDLLYDLGFDVTLVDWNEMSLYGMKELMRNKNVSENCIVSDWLELEGFEKEFDLVVGDHFLNNLKIGQYEKIFTFVKSILNKDGVFITNMMISEDEGFDIRNLKNIDIGVKDKFNLFYKANSNLWFDEKNQEINMFKWNIETKKLGLDKLWIDIFDKDFFMTMPRQDVFEKMAKKHFDIIDMKFSDEHEIFKYYKIYMLK